jgi:hypothetical protein
MKTQNLPGPDRLLTVWQKVTGNAASDGRGGYEIDPLGRVAAH